MGETKRDLTGAQILSNCKLKARIIGRRNFDAFMRGERDYMPCTGDIEDMEIAKAFDRLSAGASHG